MSEPAMFYHVKVTRDPATAAEREVYFRLEMAPDWPGMPWEEIAEDLRQSIMTAASGLVDQGAYDVPVYAPGSLTPAGHLRRLRS